MSAYASGAAAAVRGVGISMADTPATEKWRGDMERAKAALRAKYGEDRPYTVREVLADVDHWWQIASKFASEASELTTMTPARIKQARDNSLNLLEARAQLRIRKPDEIVTPAQGRVYLEAMQAPIDWLIGVGTPVLSDAEDRAAFWKRALWIGVAIGGALALSKLINSGVAAKRELVGDRPLIGAPRGLVTNPPAWAADPITWETARSAVEQSGPFENPEAVTIHVYKQLGGRVS